MPVLAFLSPCLGLALRQQNLLMVSLPELSLLYWLLRLPCYCAFRKPQVNEVQTLSRYYKAVGPYLSPFAVTATRTWYIPESSYALTDTCG